MVTPKRHLVERNLVLWDLTQFFMFDLLLKKYHYKRKNFNVSWKNILIVKFDKKNYCGDIDVTYLSWYKILMKKYHFFSLKYGNKLTTLIKITCCYMIYENFL